jgi:glycosyltransferase involved in cell wall biosynthesis
LLRLQERLPSWIVRAQLVELSRNFGSFAAIAAGLERAAGDYFAVIAADLQEPPDLVLEFHKKLTAGEADIVLGHRAGRTDPWASQMLSESFWGLYRRFVVKDMPKGGIDVFGCTRDVRDHLLGLRELNTNLIALLFWLGFRRAFVPYTRQPRREGRSAWTLGRKFRYAIDSIFSFTDLPIRALLFLGALGTAAAVVGAVTVFIGWAMGHIPVLGYTPLMLVITFFGGLTALGLGIIGQYVWLSLQNVRGRPTYVVKSAWVYERGQRAIAARKSS